MKITIYELLGMIKDGKAPKKIMYESEEYVWNDIDKTYYCCDHDRTDLLNDYVITNILSNEVEILETTITYKQDKIEKLYLENIHTTDTFNLCEHTNEQFEEVNNKINEIIDRLNNK